MRKQRHGSDRLVLNPLPADILLTLPDLDIEVDRVTRDEAWAICPNPKHPERSPSWSINLDTGEHNCFACGWGGNYIYLVQTCRDLDTPKAEEWIRKRGGIGVARKKLRGESAWTKKKAKEVEEADLALFDPLIPMSALKSRDIIQEAAEAYGVLWNPKQSSWIFPVRDPYTGRLRGWQEKSKTLMLNYPEHMEKADTLFGYHLLGETAYVEESPLDCLHLWTYSVDGAVSGYGVHISDLQMELLIDHPKVKRIVMCLDNDKAGRLKEREIWTKYRGRTSLWFANYEHTKKKDHGEMEPDEIEYSLDHAISALRFRP
jgi:DNA primase